MRIALIEHTEGRVESPAASEEQIEVYCWRMEELLRAGYSRLIADALAVRSDVDLHRACRLLERGCGEEIAFRILS